jgi:ribonuclease P protein component
MATVITSSQEIGSILNEGSCLATPFFTLFYREACAHQGEGDSSEECAPAESRVAFIAGKRNGNAVWRNGAKRKLRGAWRLSERAPVDSDIVLMAKKAITDASAVDVARSLDDALMRAGLLQ